MRSNNHNKNDNSKNGMTIICLIFTFLLLVPMIYMFVSNNANNANGIEANAEMVKGEGAIAYSETSLLDTLQSWAYNTFFNADKVLENQIPIIAYTNNSKSALFEDANFTSEVFGVYEEDEIEDSGHGSKDIKIEIQNNSENYQAHTIEKSDNPQILIYHTHASETYMKTKDFDYVSSGQERTTDNNKNIVYMGNLLQKELNEKYGFKVLHDKTNVEAPELKTAYARSLKVIEGYKEKNDDLQVYIDIHRDSYETAEDQRDYVEIDGKKCAKIMMVVGTGNGTNGQEIFPKPNYKSNYALAKKITDNLNSIQKGLGKDVRVKDNRYNQHISNACLLIEIGYNGSTFEEAKNSIPYLAKAIANSIEKR